MPKSNKKRLNLRHLGFKTKTMTSKRASKSSAMISPGDIIMFTYPRKLGNYLDMPIPVLALVVARKGKGGSSLYISGKKNKLLSVFDISEASPEVVKIIIRELYKNRRRCTYSIVKGLVSILGPDTYRTFNAKRVSTLYEIFLN